MNWQSIGALITGFLGFLFKYLQNRRDADDESKAQKHLKKEAENDKLIQEINAPSMDPARAGELLSDFDPPQKAPLPKKTGS